jgi:transposase
MTAAVIRIDAAWLATAPLDMRAGTDTALARVVAVFGAAHPHHAYLFANKRANRMKVLVHDGIGIWLAARRLHQGKFVWPSAGRCPLAAGAAQLDALVLGLPWQRMGEAASSPWSESRCCACCAIGRCANGQRRSGLLGTLLPW